MKQIHTEIDISTPAEKLWNILLDFEQYPAWNPFIIEATGDVNEGSRLVVRVDLPEGNAMTFKPTVKMVRENHELCWLGRFLVPGLFDGEHCFKIENLDNGRSRFIQREKFSGILVPLFWKSMGSKTKKGFELMNNAIKKRAEE